MPWESWIKILQPAAGIFISITTIIIARPITTTVIRTPILRTIPITMLAIRTITTAGANLLEAE